MPTSAHVFSLLVWTAWLGLAPGAGGQVPPLGSESIGELRLEGGGVLADCVVTFREWGQRNASGRNTILFPTFFNGTSADLAAYIGPGRILDPARHHILAIDALGNGLSTSPSNYLPARSGAFPRITIADMVEAQRRLLDRLGIREAEAIVGISMGGMQLFEWLVRYPGFARSGVSIVSTPRMSERDIALWAKAFPIGRRNEPPPEDQAGKPADRFGQVLGILGMVVNQAPKYRDPFNAIRQFEAISRHDIARPFNGELAAAGAKIRVPVLTVVATEDQAVSPETAIEFARAQQWPVVTLAGREGHNIYKKEAARIGREIERFLGTRSSR